ncbi:hypothetical protein OHR68_13555 [Spirillospora sp. NBC_00431]
MTVRVLAAIAMLARDRISEMSACPSIRIRTHSSKFSPTLTVAEAGSAGSVAAGSIIGPSPAPVVDRAMS